MSRKSLVRTGLGVLVLFTISIAWLGYKNYLASQHVPEFYQSALAISDERVRIATYQLGERLEQLSTELQSNDQWELRLTEDQINGWLANRLRSEYPLLLPNGTSEPRVAIENGNLFVAARYRFKSIDMVVSGQAAVTKAQKVNELSIDVKSLNAGSLPLPVQKFAHKICAVCRRAGLELSWDDSAELPRAFVIIPSKHPGYRYREVIVESIEVGHGEIRLAGRVLDGTIATVDNIDLPSI